jgi:hypothetical protein
MAKREISVRQTETDLASDAPLYEQVRDRLTQVILAR